MYKPPLEMLIQLYNQIPNDIKHVSPKTFKRKLKKYDINFTPES